MKSLWTYMVLGGLIFSLTGCADLEDEQFAIIPGKFPKLVDVPDRPETLQMKDGTGHQYFADLEKKLLKEREEEYRNQKKNYDQMKVLSPQVAA